jgi:membrane-bound metal-dependent hydrolase YbcI (DUF457 family)
MAWHCGVISKDYCPQECTQQSVLDARQRHHSLPFYFFCFLLYFFFFFFSLSLSFPSLTHSSTSPQSFPFLS